jgi:hypothetical protein
LRHGRGRHAKESCADAKGSVLSAALARRHAKESCTDAKGSVLSAALASLINGTNI